MSENGFIKLKRSQKLEDLIVNFPNAFLLLTIIALRARRNDGRIDGLRIGECYIGDHFSAGLTRQQYRTAIAKLCHLKLVEIISTSRSRARLGRNSTIDPTIDLTTGGTKVKLLNSDIYDINSNDDSHQINHDTNHRPTTDQPPTNHKQEGIRKNKNDKKDIYLPSNAARSSGKSAKKNKIDFSFDERKFLNINPEDLAGWKEAYPGIDCVQQLREMREWLLGSPESAPKSKFRAFITRWLKKEQNKIAYQSSFKKGDTDRRTKDIQGNPVENQYEGKF